MIWCCIESSNRVEFEQAFFHLVGKNHLAQGWVLDKHCYKTNNYDWSKTVLFCDDWLLLWAHTMNALNYCYHTDNLFTFFSQVCSNPKTQRLKGCIYIVNEQLSAQVPHVRVSGKRSFPHCWRERSCPLWFPFILSRCFWRKNFEKVIEIPFIPLHWIWWGRHIKNACSLCVSWPLYPALGNSRHVWQIRTECWSSLGVVLFIVLDVTFRVIQH